MINSNNNVNPDANPVSVSQSTEDVSVDPNSLPQMTENIVQEEPATDEGSAGYVKHTDKNLKFAAVPAGVGAAIADVGKKVFTAVEAVAKDPNVQAAGKAFVTEAIKDVKHKVETGASPIGGGGKPGNGDKSNYPSSRKGYVLAEERLPSNISFSTGIKPPTFNPLYNDCDSYNSSLHIDCLRLGVPSVTGDCKTYFDNVIVTNLQAKLQSAVKFNINLDDMSVSNIRDYVDALFFSLEMYYFVNSIIQYTNEPNNKNDGMIYLRSLIDADSYNAYSNLESLLRGIPIPPNLLTFVFWTHQNYVMSDMPNLTVHKFCPLLPARISSVGIAEGLNNCIDLLTSTSTSVRKVISIIARCCPSWVSSSAVLPQSFSTPAFDLNWKTLWMNNSYKYYSQYTGGDIYGPVLQDGSVLYWSCTNDLDGAVYGLLDYYSGPNAQVSGTITPVKSTTNLGDSRITFNGSTFVSSLSNSHYTLYRGSAHIHSNTGSSINVFYHTPTGTLRTYDNTKETISQANKELFDWIINIDSIKGPNSKNFA